MATCKGGIKKGSLEEFQNGAHLKQEEIEDLGIPRSKLMSMEMEFLRRTARRSRLEKIRSNVIREK